jgi:hypothetical protein
LAFIGVGLVWLLTARYGAPQVKRELLLTAALNARAGTREVSETDDPKKWRYPWFYCRAHSVAPLVVKVDYGYASGPLGMSFGSSYYLWFFGAIRLLGGGYTGST